VIDLEKEHLAEVQSILRSYVPDSKVYVFGSRATGKAGRFSDLDLVVEGKTELGLLAMAELKDAFRESNLPFRVDVLDWLSISDAFRKRIKHECFTIQEPKE